MRDLILNIIKDDLGQQAQTGLVLSVDESDFSCTVRLYRDDSEVYPKLRVNTDGMQKSVIEVPKVNSDIVVVFEKDSNVNCHVLLCSELDKILVFMDGFKYQISEGKLVFNDGQNGSMVILPELLAQIQNLNTFLDSIRTAFSAFTPSPGDGGAALKAVMLTAIQSLPLADLSNAGNDKIKH